MPKQQKEKQKVLYDEPLPDIDAQQRHTPRSSSSEIKAKYIVFTSFTGVIVLVLAYLFMGLTVKDASMVSFLAILSSIASISLVNYLADEEDGDDDDHEE